MLIGLPYYAAHSGVVVHASDRVVGDPGRLSNYGYHVYLRDERTGYHTLYAHARSGLPVAVGDAVSAGEVVGISGNTGNSTGYHLHFGLLSPTDTGNGFPMWAYGQLIDPLPYVEGLEAPPSSPQPPTPGVSHIGLHASADPGELWGGEAEYNEFKTLRPGVIKVLSSHSPQAVARLYNDQASIGNTGIKWIIRAFLTFTENGQTRDISPIQFYNDTISDVTRSVDVLLSLGVPHNDIMIELHNEPNLTQEGLGVSWSNGEAFRSWFTAVVAQYRQALPNIPLMFPGLSPGGDYPGVRQDAATFLDQCQSAIALCDYMGAHAYWSSTYPRSLAVGWVAYHARFNLPVYVTEASINDRPAAFDDERYAQEYYNFNREITAAGVAFFVASASNPDFDHPDKSEAWIHNGQTRGIAAMIRDLI